jgi:tetratricopeptide (TPR) repeat protein
MEQVAYPGSILMTGETLRQVMGYVAVRALGPVPVKGLPDPVEAVELQGAGPARTRMQTLSMRGRTRFVGRETECALLGQVLTQAQSGRGQVVTVVGEPGVGKSRLIHEFTHAPETRGWLILESHTRSYGHAVPYLPVRDLLKAYFQLQDGEAPQRIRERLTGQLLQLETALGPVLLPLLGLLDVPVEEPTWQALDPLQRRQRVLDAVKRLLLRESQRQPLLLVCEDLHWADAETEALLEALDANHPAAQVERLADHAVRGEVWEKALQYCRQAGVRADARLAHQEATTWFRQALEAMRHLPERRELLEQAVDLRFDLGEALVPLMGSGPGMHLLGGAERLAESLGDRQRLGRVYGSQAKHLRILRKYDRALGAGQRALTIATDLDGTVLRVTAHGAMAEAYYGQGDYRWAIDLLRECVASLDSERLQACFGLDRVLLAVTCRAWLVRCLAEVGAFAEGTSIAHEAVRMAEAVEHPLSQLIAYDGAGILYLRQGDLPRAIRILERGLELRQARGIRHYLGFPGDNCALACAYALSGRVPEALRWFELIRESRVPRREGWSVFLGEAYWLTGRPLVAHMCARSALQASRTLKERGQEGWALRLLGEISSRQDPPATRAAEASYRQALLVAEELRMRPLLAHCHLGLGTLYANLERWEQARAELSAAIALYRAVDMTFWLPQAEAALARLEGP